jgi:K+-sensing histidine kinase KdpD
MKHFRPLNQKLIRFGAAFISVALITFFLEPFHALVNTATIALCFLLLILFIATFIGRNPALLASTAAMLCFNYFFIPPVRTWTISEPQNLIAWAAFMITAVTAGELSAYAKRRAEQAENQKREIERLYEELRTAFAKASEAEALRQSEKLKSALLDAVTHDLRTPLTSIKVLATTLLDSEGGHRSIELDSESKHEFLETIINETNRLNEFIEGMVELAQIEAGSLGLRRGWDEIPEIIEAALMRAEKSLQGRRILLKIEENLPILRVDSKLLSEVIYTLLDNAAKYSPDGSQIEIGARHTDRDAMEISVTDEGQGVPIEWREKVFDKFFRIEESSKSAKKPKGMGLGLTIAKGIIEAHGGKIWVADNPNGHGAKFVLRVPIGDE